MKIHFEAQGVQLVEVPTPDEGLLQLFEATILGTPGRMRYRHQNVRTRIAQLPPVRYLKLQLHNRVIGAIAIVNEWVGLHDQKIAAAYIRYLTIRTPTSNMSREQDNRSKRSQGILHHVLSHLMNDPAFLWPELDPKIPLISYAYVDGQNFPSRNMIEQMGYVRVGTFSTVIFSRFNPQPTLLTQKSDSQEWLAHMHWTHRKSGLYPFHSDHYTDSLFDCYDGDKRIGGLHAEKIEWKIEEMPGLSGFLMLNVLRHMPWIGKMIDPDPFGFCAVEGLHTERGSEHLIPEMLESICHRFGTQKALMWVDPSDPLHSYLQTRKNGLLARLTRIHPAFAYVLPVRIDPNTLQELQNSPLYISAIHFT